MLYIITSCVRKYNDLRVMYLYLSFFVVVSAVQFIVILFLLIFWLGCSGRDRMGVGFTYNQWWVWISIRARCTTLCDKFCQWLATGRWFSPGPPVSSTNKTDRHDITEILLKVALSWNKQTNKHHVSGSIATFTMIFGYCFIFVIFCGVQFNVIYFLLVFCDW